MTERIRTIVGDQARLPEGVTVDDETDLFEVGMTSHASVNVMLALEDAFDVEFPDRMLTRNTFASVASIRSALAELGVEDAA